MHSPLSISSATHTAPATGSADSNSSAPSQSTVDSAELLRGQKAVQIHHNGAVYRLQATKLGKLILTK